MAPDDYDDGSIEDGRMDGQFDDGFLDGPLHPQKR